MEDGAETFPVRACATAKTGKRKVRAEALRFGKRRLTIKKKPPSGKPAPADKTSAHMRRAFLSPRNGARKFPGRHRGKQNRPGFPCRKRTATETGARPDRNVRASAEAYHSLPALPSPVPPPGSKKTARKKRFFRPQRTSREERLFAERRNVPEKIRRKETHGPAAQAPGKTPTASAMRAFACILVRTTTPSPASCFPAAAPGAGPADISRRAGRRRFLCRGQPRRAVRRPALPQTRRGAAKNFNVHSPFPGRRKSAPQRKQAPSSAFLRAESLFYRPLLCGRRLFQYVKIK